MIRRILAAFLVALSRQKPGRPPFAFHDNKGRSYYTWSDFSELPRMRRLEVDTVMLWIDAGRPKTAIEEIGEAIRAQAEAAAGAKQQGDRSKALAAIAALSQELLMRTTLVPEECYYALAAATCVREDERDPSIIDPAIHQDKIETFRSAGRAGHAFFTTPILKAMLGAVYTTESNWRMLLLEWAKDEARHRAALKVCAPASAQ
jgi:hypothetical protein